MLCELYLKLASFSNFHNSIPVALKFPIAKPAQNLNVNRPTLKLSGWPSVPMFFDYFAWEGDIMTHIKEENDKIEEKDVTNGLSKPWFILGCALTFLGALLALWTFSKGNLTPDQRYILKWIFPIVSGFACGCFTGSIKSTGKAATFTVAAAGGFAVWLLTIFIILPPETDTFIQTFKIRDENYKPVNHGSISLVVGQTTLKEPINNNADATFREIPYKFRNESFKINIDIKKYALLEPSKEYNFADSQIDVIVKQKKLCIGEIYAIITDTKEFSTTLDASLTELKMNMQSSYSIPIFLVFTKEVVKNNLHKNEFRLFRNVKKELSLCEILSDIEGQYNRSNTDKFIRIYISCDTILVASENEKLEKGDYTPCTPKN